MFSGSVSQPCVFKKNSPFWVGAARWRLLQDAAADGLGPTGEKIHLHASLLVSYEWGEWMGSRRLMCYDVQLAGWLQGGRQWRDGWIRIVDKWIARAEAKWPAELLSFLSCRHLTDRTAATHQLYSNAQQAGVKKKKESYMQPTALNHPHIKITPSITVCSVEMGGGYSFTDVKLRLIVVIIVA